MRTAISKGGFRALAPDAPVSAPLPLRPTATGFRVRIWDLPTRLFHWSLATSLVGLAVTGHAGGAWMDMHARMGSLVLSLLLFRLVWGVVGGRWSRFATFVPTAARLRRYLRGEGGPRADVGHSPLGALSVLAMLGLLFAQVATGLVADDGGGFTGPLNAQVSTAGASIATMLHRKVGQWMLLGLVLLHVGAIAFYRIRRGRKLVRAMFDGDKMLPMPVNGSRDNAATRLQAACVLAACLLAVGAVTGF